MIVEVKQGKLEGVRNKSKVTGQEYICFRGIPYAKPPIGDLRFRAPIPIEKWDGILPAKKNGAGCIQFEFSGRGMGGSEDCLYLNVFTPQPPDEIEIPKPVMVFIHGGGFFSGSSSSKLYGPDFLLGNDIVYVAFNYRLHVFGFLNLGIEDCPGNCGLKDQQLALRWIKENIRQFGGDPHNITIFGESAGASSVSLHMIAPSSTGLFDKVIMQSGSALSGWSLTPNPQERATELCRRLGFEDTDPQRQLQFLKRQSAVDITTTFIDIDSEQKKRMRGSVIHLSFSASVEKIKENSFLPDLPSVLLKTAKPVPVIAGFCDKEGRLAFIIWGSEFLQSLDKDFTPVIKRNFPCHPQLLPKIADEVKNFYFGDKPIGLDLESAEHFTDLYTDLFFLNFYDSFDFVTKTDLPVFVYEFSFWGKFNIYSQIFAQDLPFAESGASHADDLPYLFYQKEIFGDVTYEEPELNVVKTMCAFWTNFARTGNPTNDKFDFEWKPSTNDSPYYLQIKDKCKPIRGRVLSDRLDFWKKMIELMRKNNL